MASLDHLVISHILAILLNLEFAKAGFLAELCFLSNTILDILNVGKGQLKDSHRKTFSSRQNFFFDLSKFILTFIVTYTISNVDPFRFLDYPIYVICTLFLSKIVELILGSGNL